MRNQILVMCVTVILSLGVQRHIIIRSPGVHVDQQGPPNVIRGPPEVHMDQEKEEGIVEQPAEIPLIFRILYPWAVPRKTIRGSPETPMREEPRNVRGAPETPMEEKNMKRTEQPAEIPLIFRILYPWAVPRKTIKETPMGEEPRNVRGAPETPMGEKNMKRAEQPVEETVSGSEHVPPEPISWFILLTRPPVWFSLAVLMCFLIVKYVLRQYRLARILGGFMMFQELIGFIYLLIDIWNRRGPVYENIILPLYIKAGDWPQWVVTGLWSVWSKGWVALDNTVPPVLIEMVTEHRSQCILGVITMLVVLLLIYFKPFYRLRRPTSSNITPSDAISPPCDTISPPRDAISPESGTLPPPSDAISPPRDAISPASGALSPPSGALPAPRGTISPASGDDISPTHDYAVSPTTEDTVSPTREDAISPASENAASAMEERSFPIPSVAPTRMNTWPWCDRILPTEYRPPALDTGLDPRWKRSTVHPSVARRRRNEARAMTETDVPVSIVTPPRASFRDRLSQRIKKLKSKVVSGHRKIFPRKRDIPPSDVIISPTTPTLTPLPSFTFLHLEEEEWGFPPSLSPIPLEEEVWGFPPTLVPFLPPIFLPPEGLWGFPEPSPPYFLQPSSSNVSGHRKIFPRKSDIIPSDVIPTSKSAESAMEEIEFPIPSVTPPRDPSDDISENGGIFSIPSSLMSPVTDDNKLLDSAIGEQSATQTVDPNDETRSNQTRLHLRELLRLVKKRRATKEDRQEPSRATKEDRQKP